MSAIAPQTIQTVTKPVVPFNELKIKAQFSLTAVHADAVVVKELTTVSEVAESNPVYLSLDHVKGAISKFSEQKNESGARQIFATLSTALISLNGSAASIEILNEVQREMLTAIKQDLLDHIRKELGHSGLTIDIKVAQHAQETKAYKPSDKFKFLAEKNPMLLELKKRFDLEIEY